MSVPVPDFAYMYFPVLLLWVFKTTSDDIKNFRAHEPDAALAGLIEVASETDLLS